MEIKIRRNTSGDLILIDSSGTQVFTGEEGRLELFIEISKTLDAQDAILKKVVENWEVADGQYIREM